MSDIYYGGLLLGMSLNHLLDCQKFRAIESRMKILCDAIASATILKHTQKLSEAGCNLICKYQYLQRKEKQANQGLLVTSIPRAEGNSLGTLVGLWALHDSRLTYNRQLLSPQAPASPH